VIERIFAVLIYVSIMDLSRCYKTTIFIRLEARLRPNIGNTLRCVSTVFTRSAITPPELNWFGWNLGHSENDVCRWLRKILGAIPEKRQRESEANFCHVSNARLHRFPVGQISRNLHTKRREWAKNGPPWFLKIFYSPYMVDNIK